MIEDATSVESFLALVEGRYAATDDERRGVLLGGAGWSTLFAVAAAVLLSREAPSSDWFLIPTLALLTLPALIRFSSAVRMSSRMYSVDGRGVSILSSDGKQEQTIEANSIRSLVVVRGSGKLMSLALFFDGKREVISLSECGALRVAVERALSVDEPVTRALPARPESAAH